MKGGAEERVGGGSSSNSVKMVLLLFKSKMKWVGLIGLVLSAFSLFVHFLLARFTFYDQVNILEFKQQSSITVFSWRPVFQYPDMSKYTPMYKRLWGPVRNMESLHPDASARGDYFADIGSQPTGFIFVRIQGGFHEIRNSISDVVVISRLLNATLVVPEIQSTTSSKGISSQFKSFSYLYNEEQFMVALAKDVRIVKTLPKNLKGERRKKKIPSFKLRYSSSPYYFLHHVLPVLKRHAVVELVISEGGCLQATLPSDFEEYQRLRCRVAYHALRFRQEVQELAITILHRLRAPGRPFIAYDPGMTREALAYYGCAELFQDVHAELIQHKRAWMIKRGIVKGKLSVNSAEQRLNGSCPLMPEEIGILLRAYGYSWDTIIYVAGGEVFGGQRKMIALHGMFENVVDRTVLTTNWELNRIYGREARLVNNYPRTPPPSEEVIVQDAWKNAGPRPRPLPPPPARPKTYNVEGWWGWVAESDNEPDSTVMELRMNAHKLLWEAIDYIISVEADVFISGFDRDGKGHPNFGSLVMGHRLYQSAASKSFRLDRKEVVKLLEDTNGNPYHANRTWITLVRKHLRRSLLDGLTESSTSLKPLSFLSHPIPECSCRRYDPTETLSNASSPAKVQVQTLLGGVVHRCPAWMHNHIISPSKDKENEEELDESDPLSSSFFFGHSSETQEGLAVDSNKDEAQVDDQEELEGGEK